MKISVGKPEEIKWHNGNWLILDLGFSKHAKSCALIKGDEPGQCFTFNRVVEEIIETTKEKCSINLVVEAPLSVCFDKHGNPTGRNREKLTDGRHRYWYEGLGCAVLTAATYLVRRLADDPSSNEIRLFEGFISFKDQNSRSDHLADVESLRQAIKTYEEGCRHVVKPGDLQVDQDDCVKSAFDILGLDIGVPPIICCV